MLEDKRVFLLAQGSSLVAASLGTDAAVLVGRQTLAGERGEEGAPDADAAEVGLEIDLEAVEAAVATSGRRQRP